MSFFWVHGEWIVAWDKQIACTKHSNRHLTSFDVFITAHVIWSHCCTTCWLCSSGIESKNFNRVQRRKYDTIVNIIPTDFPSLLPESSTAALRMCRPGTLIIIPRTNSQWLPEHPSLLPVSSTTELYICHPLNTRHYYLNHPLQGCACVAPWTPIVIPRTVNHFLNTQLLCRHIVFKSKHRFYSFNGAECPANRIWMSLHLNILVHHLKKGYPKQEAQRATYRAPEYNVPPFWGIGQGRHFCLLISPKNTNLVEGFEILLPV